MHDIPVVILAAGRGSRIGELGTRSPKSLILLNNLSSFEYQLLLYSRLGLRRISVVTGYLSESFESFTAVSKIHNSEWDKTNMFSSVLIANETIGDEDTLFVYGDIVFEQSAIEMMLRRSESIHLLYDCNFRSYWSHRFKDPLVDLESFNIDSEGTIHTIGQKVEDMNIVNGQYMGIFFIPAHAWVEIRRFMSNKGISTLNSLSMTYVFNELINFGVKVVGTRYSSRWAEIDSESDLDLARIIFYDV